MRKKVFLVGPPYSGHLHPLLGLALRLRSVADVTVLSTPSGVQIAQAAGLPGRGILAEHERQVWEIVEPGTTVSHHPLRLWRQLRGNVGLMARMKHELDAILRAEGPDLVIADFTVPMAGLAAMQQGIPWWTTLPSPCVLETPDGPPAYFGGQTPAVTRLQRVKHAAMRTATRQFKRCMWLLFRKELRSLGFHGMYRADGSEAAFSPQRILALSVPEIEFPCTHPPQFQYTGPVLYTPPCHGPQPLFAEDRRPHVLISFGTHLPHMKTSLAAAVRGIAARQPGIVFHFTHGKACATAAQPEGNFHEYSYVSYADHLPRYDLVVHHGGSGVLQYCLRHGKPSVVHPLDFDQFDNAARLVSAGLALPARRPQDLEGAILRALHDSALHERCRDMSLVHSRYDAEGLITAWVARL